MPLTSTEAADALRDINRTARRSANAYGYNVAAPHLMLWGVIWAIGYGFTALNPQAGQHSWLAWAWPALSLAGVAGSFYMGWRMRAAAASGFDWRTLSTFVAVFAFIIALFNVVPPSSNAQIGAFFPLLASLFYALVGIWTRGARLIVLGIVVAALTLFAYFTEPAHFAEIMAVVGGGGLILGGFWLRSV